VQDLIDKSATTTAVVSDVRTVEAGGFWFTLLFAGGLVGPFAIGWLSDRFIGRAPDRPGHFSTPGAEDRRARPARLSRTFDLPEPGPL
jgi:MFS family permease